MLRSLIPVLALVSCGGAAPAILLPAGWKALAPMPLARGESAIATLDGKIYLAGGFDTQRSFQIYDVVSDTWEQGPSLPSGTDNAGAVAVPGKIYVFGGEASQAVQIYDVAGKSWSVAGPLPGPRYSSVVELLDGKVHLAGGWSFDRSNNVSIATHAVFDLASAVIVAAPLAPLLTARNHAVHGVISGKVYVAGGRGPGHEGNDASNIASTEMYDPATDTWTARADLPTPRSGGAGAVLDGKLYVLGGGLPGNTVHKTVERYDPAANAWEKLGDMPAAATGHAAVAVGASIYVFGGFINANGQRLGNGGVTSAYRYTP